MDNCSCLKEFSFIRNVTFKNNTAGKFGGGVYLSGLKNITIYDLYFQNNTVSLDKSDSMGGAIYVINLENIQFINMFFSNNSASDNGIFYCQENCNNIDFRKGRALNNIGGMGFG